MRISDWGSCVCSSDLAVPRRPRHPLPVPRMPPAREALRTRPQPRLGPRRRDGAVQPGVPVQTTSHAQDRDRVGGAAVARRNDQMDLAAQTRLPRQTPATGHLHPRRWSTAVLTRSEEHTSELQSLMRISYAVFCLKQKNIKTSHPTTIIIYTTRNRKNQT